MDENGIRLLKSKVAAISDYFIFTKRSQLKMSMLNFYLRLLPHCSEVTHPLIELLRLPKGKFIFTDNVSTAFEKIKEVLRQINLLLYPKPEARLALLTEASNRVIGAATN